MNDEARLYEAGYIGQFRGADFKVTLWLSPVSRKQVTTEEALNELRETTP
ncbi:hypothetical protein LCGC14_1993280 [marine sediment metagenome]|uniref:Uncharacterized protein n=1 Tax=marine sediment metagenome TaxID=412755 RepID=A0A0F9FTF8_9ZZZZ